MSVIQNLSDVIQREVETTLLRLYKSIFASVKEDHSDVDAEDYDIDMEKFAKNTVKKILETKDFKAVEKKLSHAKKEKRDPEAPMGAKNAFLFFSSEKRSEVKEQNIGMKPCDITKKLGEMWREMDDEDKEEFQHKAKEDKDRFNDEMGDYEPKEGFKCPKKSPKKESLSPKRVRSSYIFFCCDKRQEVTDKLLSEGKKKTEVLTKLGKMWKELDDEDKKPYEKMVKNDKKRYESEMKNFKPIVEDDESDDEKPTPKPKKSSDDKTDDEKPTPKKSSDDESDDEKPTSKPTPKPTPKKSSDDESDDEKPTPKPKSKKKKSSDDEKPTRKPKSKKKEKKQTVIESDDEALLSE
jgi:hypothetical protein